jgi:hypothetical protein
VKKKIYPSNLTDSQWHHIKELFEAVRSYVKFGLTAGYRGVLSDWVSLYFKFVLSVVLRSDKRKEFIVLPKCWIVRHTFVWLS